MTPGRRAELPVALTGVGAVISASHIDPMTGVTHGHSWEVIAWYQCEHDNDAGILRAHLEKMCAAFDHTILPSELSRGEDLAKAILKLSPPSCIEVEVRRPLERLYARAMA